MSVTIDLGSVRAFHRKLKRELDDIPDIILDEVRVAAQNTRSSHAYINRSGDLQNGTQAELLAADQFFVHVALVMSSIHDGYDYAKYIDDKGLTNFEAEARAAEVRISAKLK